jgi:glycosyltransferase involved in cell wall biosynthesis
MTSSPPSNPVSEERPSAPFFSIVLACCDVEPFVAECFQSVLSQPFSDWEIVAVVETSKDRTEEIVRSFAARDSRIQVATGPRSGSCSVPRNRGVELARGDYVLFLDGDDFIAPGALRRLRDAIAARPGADLYPCAIQVRDDATGRDLEIRDNYPPDAPPSLSGPEALLLASRHKNGHPHPQMQLTLFRRTFLLENGLRCVPGLRRQDSEFSPRALYLARRVVPLHEPYYVYRLQPASVGSSARGAGHFHGDWAVILRSLLAFHARVSRDPGFDPRVADAWRRQWLSWIFYFWFAPPNLRAIPRPRRLETLSAVFSGDFRDFDALLAGASRPKRLAGAWVRAFVARPALRGAAELFFRAYFSLADAKRPK